MAPTKNHYLTDLNDEEDSGSDSDGGNSSGSGSRSTSPESVKNAGNASNRGSERSRSRSPSPNSRASGSPRSNASSPERSRRDSGSDVPEEGSQKSLSPANSAGSRASESQRSRSPVDNKSNASPKASDRSRSVSRERGEKHYSRSRSLSRSEGSNQSRQSSAGSNRSASRRSRSPSGNRSGSGSAKARSRSMTPHSDRSQSKSPKSDKSRGSPVKKDTKGRSRSGSPVSKKEKSRSGSPVSEKQKSRSSSPASGKESGKEKSGDESGGQRSPKKRKRAVLSDDSGSDVEKAKKKTALSDSEEDKDEGKKNLVIDAEALFGDASDISSDEENKKGRKALKVTDDEEEIAENEREKERERESDAGSEKDKSGDEGNEAEMNERDEDKENVPEEPVPETRIDVEIPKITTDLGKELHFVKLPNFLSVETRPFDPSTYEDEIDEEETLDEEGRARLKLKVENTIRWKEINTATETKKQSNARFVRWSDGSMSLHLGSEIFDVYKQPLQGDHNHLFIRQGTGLQGQAVFRTKLTFRPHSTESFTHRKMTMSLADRSQKTSGIKVLSLVGKDPEAHRGELIKKEEERLRASVRRESKQKRVREKGASRGLSAGYLEPDRYGDMDSDDEGISINAIKKQHKNKLATQKGDRPHIYSSDEEGSDIETRRARRLDKAKALKDSDSEDEGSGGGEPENQSGGGTSSEE